MVLWCKFAAFYEETLLLHRDCRHHHRVRRAALLKQAAVYEKAVEYNGNSTILLLRRLNLHQIRGDEDIDVLWRSTIERHPLNTTLWLNYLHFAMAQSRNERVGGEGAIDVVVEDAVRSLEAAKQRAFSTMKWHGGPDSADLRSHVGSSERALLSVFMAHCRFRWRAGFRARALAMVQALIELNLFGPAASPQIADQFERNMVYLQLFWESGCCRVGEAAAVGFGKFVDLLLNSGRNEEDKASLLSLFGQRRRTKQGLPQCDDDRGDDVVLFEEVRGFLFELNDPDLQRELLLSAFGLIGVDRECIGESAEWFSKELFADSLHIECCGHFVDSAVGSDHPLSSYCVCGSLVDMISLEIATADWRR